MSNKHPLRNILYLFFRDKKKPKEINFLRSLENLTDMPKNDLNQEHVNKVSVKRVIFMRLTLVKSSGNFPQADYKQKTNCVCLSQRSPIIPGKLGINSQSAGRNIDNSIY